MDKLYSLAMNPGIQRDGTQFATRNFIDGVWCRFQRKLPKKIGGYQSLFFFNNTYTNVPRGTITIPYNESFYIYFGTSSHLYLLIIDEYLNVLNGPINITPFGFVASDDISWTFDTMFSVDTNNIMIIAHPGYNLNNLNNRTQAPVYFGVVGRTVALTSIGQSCSGGIVVLNPYLMLLDNDGTIRQSAASKPNVFNLNESGITGTRITSQKLLAGRETRGGQFNPCGLIWSSDTLMRYYFSIPLESFRADKIGKSSLLSSNAIAEIDNIFIWAGTDRFMYYNGTINYLPNTYSINFFFNNLNYAYREKVWTAISPHFNEIWFHFPMGNSKECNWAVIYNKENNIWYDTPIARSCGYFDYSFNAPIWLNYETPSGVNIWVHETGYDKKGFDVDGNPLVSAIDSYIQTGNIAFCAFNPMGELQGLERWVNLRRIEPDFIQSGPINVYVIGKEYANSTPVVSSYPAINPNTLKVDIHTQFRELTLKFESNSIGGNFEMGNVLLDMTVGDVRP